MLAESTRPALPPNPHTHHLSSTISYTSTPVRRQAPPPLNIQAEHRRSRIYMLYAKSRNILFINLSLFILNIACAAILVAVYFPSQACTSTFAPCFVPAPEPDFCIVDLVVPPTVLGSCYSTPLPQLASVWASRAFAALRPTATILTSAQHWRSNCS